MSSFWKSGSCLYLEDGSMRHLVTSLLWKVINMVLYWYLQIPITVLYDDETKNKLVENLPLEIFILSQFSIFAGHGFLRKYGVWYDGENFRHYHLFINPCQYKVNDDVEF